MGKSVSSSELRWAAAGPLGARGARDAARCRVRPVVGTALARSGGCVLIRGVTNLSVMNDDHATSQYEIRIRGLLSERLLSAFPEMEARARNRETVLTGVLPDQSALHGVLGRIEALGLELLEVRRPRAGAHPPGRRDRQAGDAPAGSALDQPDQNAGRR